MKKYSMLVWTSGVLGALLAVCGWCFGGGESAGAAPLTAAGDGLRALSLSGGAGNFLAWLLLLLLALLPVALLIWRGECRREEERCSSADFLLYAAVPVLFAGGWFAVNGTGEEVIGDFAPLAALGTAAALVLAWGVLELLIRAEREDSAALAGLFRGLCLACAGLMAFAAVFSALTALLTAFGSLPEESVLAAFGEYGLSNALNLMVLALRLLLELVPRMLTAVTLVWGAELAGALAGLEFTGESVALCRRTAGGCVRVVKCTLLCGVCANVLQLLLLGRLYDSAFSVDFPLLPLALTLGLLLVCRALERGKQLQDDNDSII